MANILDALKTAYTAPNKFMGDNPLAVAAARQALGMAMSQGKGPRMYLPTAYHTRGDALTGRTRMQTAERGMKFPDLTGDGKVTFADILKGRGVKREKKAMHGMKLMKKGGEMYMGGGKMYDEMPDGGKMYEDGGEMKEYMGGGSMEYGHGGEMPNVVIKLAEAGMRMPKDQRAKLAEMLMRD